MIRLRIPRMKNSILFQWNLYCISQLYAKILLKQGSLNQIRHYLMGHNQIWHYFLSKNHYFLSKILKYFGLPNWNFSVLWPKWTQPMEIKQNQTFFCGTYSDLTPYLFLSKNNVFQWLSKLGKLGNIRKLSKLHRMIA